MEMASASHRQREPAASPVENYFDYFTEIEERYLQRRGGGLLLSTLDWALIETWKDSGIPLEAALRGIDAAFDRYHLRPSKTKKVNSLAYCSQEVLAAAEEMKNGDQNAASPNRANEGFEPERVSEFLLRNAEALDTARLPSGQGGSVTAAAVELAASLRKLAAGAESRPRLEDLERHLTVLEEKLFAALLTATPEEELVAVRTEADRDLAPYRRNMLAAQIEQLHKQYVHKRLLEKYKLPRLSLFYL